METTTETVLCQRERPYPEYQAYPRYMLNCFQNKLPVLLPNTTTSLLIFTEFLQQHIHNRVLLYNKIA